MCKTEKKCLVLLNARWDIDRYMIETAKMKNVKVAPLYKLYKRDFKYKLAVLWLQKCKLPFQSLWYENWKKEISSYDIVIVNALNLNWRILSYIRKRNPYARLIVWYWDTVNEKNYLNDKYKLDCEVWSFDNEDCKRYGMHRNTQFYYPSKIETKGILFDAMFVGRDKGRVSQLKEICDLLNKSGLVVYTYVQRDKKEKGYPEQKVTKPVEYKEILKLISQSRCIIDIPKTGQTGMTMRVLESLFYSKKLITTDKSILGTEIYNQANIFIWDNPSEKKLQHFFTTPYEPVSDEILKKYSFETWIKNFENMND